ncbi:MAG: GDSL family lipase [Lachnospiraceae bacterium]|nr:GDSL family lipase [Lachnospiraceae bacterium]
MREETTWSNVHILGRTEPEEGDLELIWTGSGVEFEMNCSELGVVLEAGESVYMPWISLVLDGYWLAHIPVQQGENKYMLLRNMDPGVTHTVRIVKDFQASVDDPGCFLRLKKIVYEGGIRKPEPRKYKFEFIGDSITSGEGVLGAHEEMDWISPYFSAVKNYAVMTADAMNADFRLISQSGWGVTAGWDNNPNNTLPLIYDSVHAKRGITDYDHSSWEPDAVVVNLGTNDGGAFDNPAFTDPLTGVTYKYNKLPDGKYDPADLEKIANGMFEFMNHIREVHPASHILWVYGMLGDVMMNTVTVAVSQFWTENDTNAGYLQLPDTNGEAFGSRGHPGELSHRAASEKIVERLREVLK